MAGRLIKHYGADCPAAVVYHASWPDQKIVRGALGEIAAKAQQAGIGKTAMIIVGRVLSAAPTLPDSTIAGSVTVFARERANEDRPHHAVEAGGRGLEPGSPFFPEAHLFLHETMAGAKGGKISVDLELSREVFGRYEGLVFAVPTGVVVRAIAPLLKDKRTDPAVVVVDVGGRFAISLVGGHERGGNRAGRTRRQYPGGRAGDYDHDRGTEVRHRRDRLPEGDGAGKIVCAVKEGLGEAWSFPRCGSLLPRTSRLTRRA